MRRDQLLVVGILVFIAALFLLAFYLPNRAEIQDMKATLRKEREELLQDQRTAQAMHQLASAVQELRTMVAAVDQQLPPRHELDRFLKDLTALMAAESLDLLAVKPGNVRKGRELDELPIQVGFRGTFVGTYRFLRRLESMRRIARVDQLELAASGAGNPGRLSGTMHLCVFILRRAETKGVAKRVEQES